MRTIPLGGKRGAGQFAIVDDEDFELVTGSRWFLRGGMYAYRNETRGGPRGSMHRLVCGLLVGDPREVDHRNHDGLDNRRANLRVCVRAQNHQNRKAGYGRSQHRGVTWNAKARKWTAVVKLDGHKHYLGLFPDELDAARAAQAERLRLMPFTVEPVLL